MGLKIKLAVRDWDYLTPLALGDVKPDRFELDVHRVESLADWASRPEYDAGEVSFSQYVQGYAIGNYPVSCVPHFLMRGFRHRCILATKGSKVSSLEDLAGKRIGVTGWQDSGNTWTRALLRRAGVQIEDVSWFAGRLTSQHPVVDRLGRHARAGHIEPAPGERPLTELLQTGELDAVFTPFMPAGFFNGDSPLRFLLPDFRREELRYFQDVGYVPGIHVLGIKSQLLGENPWLAGALSEVLEESAHVWSQKRMKYADTTPWLIEDIVRTTNELPVDWNANGFLKNEKMIDDFISELYEQQILNVRLNARSLFAY